MISGPTAIEPPMFVNVIPIISAQEMFEKVATNATENDIIIKAAAVADYRPKEVCDEKIKKSDHDTEIELERTTDILAYLGKNKGKTFMWVLHGNRKHVGEFQKKIR